MNRRGFFKALAATIGGIALEEAIPFNRVWSFPKKIVIAQPSLAKLATIYYDPVAINNLRRNVSLLQYSKYVSLPAVDYATAIDAIVKTELAGGQAKVKMGLKFPYFEFV